MADLRGDQLPAATLPLTTEPMSVWQGSELRQADAEDVVVAIVSPITITASRNLADTDNGKILRCTSGVTLTVVTGLTDGFWWDFIAGAFQDAYDANSQQAMTEDANGRNRAGQS